MALGPTRRDEAFGDGSARWFGREARDLEMLTVFRFEQARASITSRSGVLRNGQIIVAECVVRGGDPFFKTIKNHMQIRNRAKALHSPHSARQPRRN